jgi:hypothetical protein
VSTLHETPQVTSTEKSPPDNFRFSLSYVCTYKYLTVICYFVCHSKYEAELLCLICNYMAHTYMSETHL